MDALYIINCCRKTNIYNHEKVLLTRVFYILQKIFTSKPRYIGKIYTISDEWCKNTLVIDTD